MERGVIGPEYMWGIMYFRMRTVILKWSGFQWPRIAITGRWKNPDMMMKDLAGWNVVTIPPNGKPHRIEHETIPESEMVRSEDARRVV